MFEGAAQLRRRYAVSAKPSYNTFLAHWFALTYTRSFWHRRKPNGAMATDAIIIRPTQLDRRSGDASRAATKRQQGGFFAAPEIRLEGVMLRPTQPAQNCVATDAKNNHLRRSENLATQENRASCVPMKP